MVGNFGFTHVGRSFDGLHFAHQDKRGNLTFVAARPTEGVFQLRGWNQLDVDLYYGSFTKSLKFKTGESDMRVFALHYHDGRRVLKTDSRTAALRANDLAKIRLTTIGGHYIGVRKSGTGRTDLLIWSAGQFGSWGYLNHRAGAVAIETGYQFGGNRISEITKPWIRGGYFRSTGDNDPNDGRHETFFQALPTPRIYARFPLFNSMNLGDASLQFRIKPHSRLALRTDLHELRLSSVNDLWYLGGGAFQQKSFGFTGRPSNGERRIGTLMDISTDLTISPMATITFYLAGLLGGNVPSRTYPDGKNARLLYIELTRRF
ncbi:MAG: alginate export family protein [Blastocatellia bacterium]